MWHSVTKMMALALAVLLLAAAPASAAGAPVQASTDGGVWTAMSSGVSGGITLRDVWGSSSSDVFAVGDAGTIVHYDGRSWTAMSSPSSNNLEAVWGSSSSDVFAVESGGPLIHYDGSTWSPFNDGPFVALGYTEGMGNLHDIWGSSASSGLFVVGHGYNSNDGPQAAVFRYDRPSAVWERRTYIGGDSSSFDGIWGSSGTNVFAVGGDDVAGFLRHYTGGTWVEYLDAESDIHFYDVWGSSSSDVFVVGGGLWDKKVGVIRHYSGGGWSSMSSGTTNSLNGIWGSSSTSVFAVGDGGTILHYDGSLWSSMSSGTANGLTAVWGISSIAFAVGAGGTILRYQAPPTIGAVDPASGMRGQSLTVTITGTGFTGATVVSFGSGLMVGTPNVDSDTRITVGISISNSAALGPRDVSVTTTAGVATRTGGFSVVAVPAPTIVSISPSQGKQGESLTVTITGTGFTGTTGVTFGAGITVGSFNVDSANQITVSVSISATSAPGSRDVSVTTSGGTGTNTAGFSVVAVSPPTITVINPGQGKQGETLEITITGTNLSGATAVTFGSGVTVNSYVADSATQVTANLTIDAAASPGARDVSVTTPDGVATSTGGFIVKAPPVITAVEPASAAQGQSLSVRITGANFTGATVVSFGSGVTVASVTVDNATQITAAITVVGAAGSCARDVSVTTPDGTGTRAGVFSIGTPPAVTPDRSSMTTGSCVVDLRGTVSCECGQPSSVTYRIDGGDTWYSATSLTAGEGGSNVWDYTVRVFLSPGTHTLQIRATGSAGGTTAEQDYATVRVTTGAAGAKLWIIAVIIVAVLAVVAVSGLLIRRLRGRTEGTRMG